MKPITTGLVEAVLNRPQQASVKQSFLKEESSQSAIENFRINIFNEEINFEVNLQVDENF